jgi:hypothetical protein
MRLAAAVLMLVAASSVARADTLTVGVFAPLAPFSATAARVDLATRLGEHLGKALGGTGTGKVFARASDFQAAIKKGEITVALVDAAYLAAAGGNYTVIAASVHGGEPTHGWQLVARGGDKLAVLKGKRLLVSALGGREVDFVLNVMLGGEVDRDYFAKIEPAPDSASALFSLGLGKADAAVVPVGLELPAGTTAVLSLPSLSGPVLVAFGPVTAQRKAELAAAAASFKGDTVISALRASDAEPIHQLAHRFATPVKRGPLAIPAVRLLVGDLVEGRTFAIERTPPAAFTSLPDRH